MDRIDNHNPVKIGIVVDDIEAAARKYAELFGIPMPKISVPDPDAPVTHTPDSYTLYRGEYVPARTKFANLQMGPVTVELLEPYDEPSPWNEFRQKHGQGVHFITFTVNGFERHIEFVESKGLPLIHKGEYGSGRYSYFDSEDVLGVVLGLQELGKKQA
ncbi:MAG: bleomycin resistance protein [Thermobacillus sp.]|uniref:VOC family protein n=1 Tax=Thermobacillus sp. TaxID=2108467 RepID=UPI000E39E497|nr:VOC family protein [Thermobacillus sp.]REK54658.1 MAG: bleomycin resistance protein [Thermobacillus sp.]